MNNTSAETPEEGKHTPGIWKVDITYKKNGYYCTSICSGDEGIIRPAVAEGLTREESIANAELIARAPSLERENSELKADNLALKAEVERLTKMSDTWKWHYDGANETRLAQAETIKRYKEALESTKIWVGQITNAYLEDGRDLILARIKSALEGTNE